MNPASDVPGTAVSTPPKNLVVAVTGATGAIYAWRLLEVLATMPQYRSHLVMSKAGVINARFELQKSRADFAALAHHSYHIDDITAALASGSYPVHAMLVLPCSIKTLAAIATGYASNLIARAADVTLKERRRLVLAVRETPFSLIHLRQMVAVTEMGGIIAPALPAFYHQPTTIETMIDHSVGRLLQLVGVENSLAPTWQGLSPPQEEGD